MSSAAKYEPPGTSVHERNPPLRHSTESVSRVLSFVVRYSTRIPTYVCDRHVVRIPDDSRARNKPRVLQCTITGGWSQIMEPYLGVFVCRAPDSPGGKKNNNSSRKSLPKRKSSVRLTQGGKGMSRSNQPSSRHTWL